MKQLPATNRSALEAFFTYLCERYQPCVTDEKSIAFNLHDTDEGYRYTLHADSQRMWYSEGIAEKASAGVRGRLDSWLRLSAGRLSPVWAILTGKLWFTGSKSLIPLLCNMRIVAEDIPADLPTAIERGRWTKPRKAAVIHASPRSTRGYSYMLTAPFVQGLRDEGVEVVEVDLSKLRVDYCVGCWHCWIKSAGQCVIKDDVPSLRALLSDCDLQVFSFPLYVDGMPAKLKALLERLVVANSYPYMVEGLGSTRHPRIVPAAKAKVMICNSGFAEASNFDAVARHMQALSHNDHTPLVASLLVPATASMFNNPTLYFDLRKRLQALREAGVEVARKGRVSSKLGREINKAIPRQQLAKWREQANAYWGEVVRDGNMDY